jgi:hypothetical protein
MPHHRISEGQADMFAKAVRTDMAPKSDPGHAAKTEPSFLDPPAPVARLRARSFNALTLDDVPEPLIDGLIAKGSTHIFYGPTAQGKSFIAIDAALHVALGRAWCGHEAIQAGVVFVAAEDAEGVVQRALAFQKHYGLEGEAVPFTVLDGMVNLRDKGVRAELIAAAQALNTAHVLFVVDTLNRASPGLDENSVKEMNEIIHACDALRAAVPSTIWLIHHAGKDAGRGMRGASNLEQGMDSFALVDNLTLLFRKRKNGRLPSPMSFTLREIELGKDRAGRPVSSCVLEQDTRVKEAFGLPANQKAALEILQTLPAAAGPGVSRRAWREACKGVLARRQSFAEAVKGLKDAGYVTETEEGTFQAVEMGAASVFL